jgi:hypothetical protein
MVKVPAFCPAGTIGRQRFLSRLTVAGGLERFPIRWKHLIEEESLGFNEVEHAGIEKVRQLFRNMLVAAGITGRRVPIVRSPNKTRT